MIVCVYLRVNCLLGGENVIHEGVFGRGNVNNTLIYFSCPEIRTSQKSFDQGQKSLRGKLDLTIDFGEGYITQMKSGKVVNISAWSECDFSFFLTRSCGFATRLLRVDTTLTRLIARVKRWPVGIAHGAQSHAT